MTCSALLAVVCGLMLQTTPSDAQQPSGILAVRFLGFSSNLPPGDALLFRQALASAIDRVAVAQAVSSIATDARAAISLAHPDLPGYNAEIRSYPFDSVAAREYWKQLPETARPTAITILVRAPEDLTATPTERRLMLVFDEAVKDTLTKTLGISVNWQRVANFSSLVAQARDGRVPIYMFAFGAGAPSVQQAGNFVIAIAKSLLRDPEVTAAAEGGEATKVEVLTIRDKVLLIPIIHYRLR